MKIDRREGEGGRVDREGRGEIEWTRRGKEEEVESQGCRSKARIVIMPADGASVDEQFMAIA